MKQGLENLILETDSPYLTPEPKREILISRAIWHT